MGVSVWRSRTFIGYRFVLSRGLGLGLGLGLELELVLRIRLRLAWGQDFLR